MNSAEHDPLDLAGQERASADKAKEERRQREKSQSDLRHVMNSKEGRRFIWRLLGETGIYRQSFSSDPLLMARNEGERNIGLKLLAELMEACPKRYLDAQNESMKDEENARANR